MDGLAEFNISNCLGDKSPECILILPRDNDCKLGFAEIFIFYFTNIRSLAWSRSIALTALHCTQRQCPTLNKPDLYSLLYIYLLLFLTDSKLHFAKNYLKIKQLLSWFIFSTFQCPFTKMSFVQQSHLRQKRIRSLTARSGFKVYDISSVNAR